MSLRMTRGDYATGAGRARALCFDFLFIVKFFCFTLDPFQPILCQNNQKTYS